MQLSKEQLDAVSKMHNGCILCGGVGSGKSRTSLAYYYVTQGGRLDILHPKPMKRPCDLYVITTAKKRDTREWEMEMIPFQLSTSDISFYKNKVVVDSWNNIAKYVGAKDSFFIFDEQRLVGRGKWVKTFLKIAKNNQWILLSATPGDKWEDYEAVFIANGFYPNVSAMKREHYIYSPYTNFPKIDRYVGTKKLAAFRDSLLVDIPIKKPTVVHHEDIYVDYDKQRYRMIVKDRWNPFTNEPIENASEYCYCLRRLVNTDVSRQMKVLELIKDHPKTIIFYNLVAELDMLKECLQETGYEIGECNGQRHDPVPEGNKWVYLVQYTAGAEGWNCISTDTIIFYSSNYSYRIMEQAAGRIDRMNTQFIDLYYYHLKSHSTIDQSIDDTLKRKKKFNENSFAGGIFPKKQKTKEKLEESNMGGLYDIFQGEDLKIASKIQQRRLQVLVHSCIYYHFNQNLVSDKQFDMWARELVQLQNDHPDISEKVPWAEAFKGFDASTGFDLPITDPWVMEKARKLLDGR